MGGKYLTARGTSLKEVYHLSGSPGSGEDLYLTEGAPKAAVASFLGGIVAFAVAGQSLASEHIGAIESLHPRRVIVALTCPGSGKTRAVGDALQNSSAARILVGTRRLAAELAEQFGYTLISGRN